MSNCSRENQRKPTYYRHCVQELPLSSREHRMAQVKPTPRKHSGQVSERESSSRKGRIIKKVIIYRREKLPKKRQELQCQHHSADSGAYHERSHEKIRNLLTERHFSSEGKPISEVIPP